MYELLVDHEADPPHCLILHLTTEDYPKMLTVCYPPVRAGVKPIPLRYPTADDARRALDLLFPFLQDSQRRIRRVG